MFQNNTDNYDQHFLIDEEVIRKYISFPKFNKEDRVVEVGPGKGTLTKRIAPLVKKITAIELDTRLKPYLDAIPNLEVIYKNVLEVEIPECTKLITSLPYSIIEPFMYKMITTNFNELYMLMGSNFILSVRDKKITKLSVLTNSYFTMDILLPVDASCFDYPPRTMSYIALFKKVDFNSLDKKYKIYNRLLYRKNKKIKNGLEETMIELEHLTKKEAKKKIQDLDIPSNLLELKYEELSNDFLIQLDQYLEKIA